MRRNLIFLGLAGGLAIAGFRGASLRFAAPQSSPEPLAPRLIWSFEAPRPGYVVPGAGRVGGGDLPGGGSSGRVPAEGRGLRAQIGTPGNRNGSTPDADAMLHTASTPLLARGRLFVGEGLHNNFSCRLTASTPRAARPAGPFRPPITSRAGRPSPGNSSFFRPATTASMRLTSRPANSGGTSAPMSTSTRRRSSTMAAFTPAAAPPASICSRWSASMPPRESRTGARR